MDAVLLPAARARMCTSYTRLCCSLLAAVQKLWVANVHRVLGDCLSDWPERIVNDPDESLLYETFNVLRTLVLNHSSDPRSAVGKVCLGSLATLAITQTKHDAEATEAGLELLVTLLSNGTAESLRQLTASFFGEEEKDEVRMSRRAPPMCRVMRAPS